MNIFGIGPLEIVFVLIIGILVLGPEGMISAGRKMGKFMRSIIKSNWWALLNGIIPVGAKASEDTYKLCQEIIGKS